MIPRSEAGESSLTYVRHKNLSKIRFVKKYKKNKFKKKDQQMFKNILAVFIPNNTYIPINLLVK